MEKTTKDEFEEIKSSLQDVLSQIKKLNESVVEISQRVDNFVVLIDQEPNSQVSTVDNQNSTNQAHVELLPCPDNYEPCPNDEEYCVFSHASEDDKKEVCESEELHNLKDHQMIVSTEPYDYTTRGGRFVYRNNPPKKVALGIKRTYSGAHDALGDQ
jgi:hypothetical protein